jgi:signal transduction histidine kinase
MGIVNLKTEPRAIVHRRARALLQLRLRLADNLPAVRADASQIQQVVMNLCHQRRRGD